MPITRLDCETLPTHSPPLDAAGSASGQQTRDRPRHKVRQQARQQAQAIGGAR